MVRLTSFVALCAACVVSGQLTALEASLAAISSRVSVISNSVSAFPTAGGSSASAQAIHAQATGLVSAINAAVTPAKNTPVLDDTDATTLIDDFEEFIGDIFVTTINLVNRKAELQKLGVASTIATDLANLKAATKTFENAWVHVVPEDMATMATGITSAVDFALETASAAFA
ncbi:hydrophobic surface binding protein A-domain-containing protein [Rhodocollybia butyracea]|uniref:Hydrophobic surface binding protein A-domain-containing protein n=1 Tax=Rhodocollybia butyracea TaxID=206335 RepID=A0A9P5U6V0_9AGAR|nr:hydrophobic surface binding protein A-domain-containing protein [Rhodocollybia butyracea]